MGENNDKTYVTSTQSANYNWEQPEKSISQETFGYFIVDPDKESMIGV